MKKFLSMVLSSVLVLSIASQVAFADEITTVEVTPEVVEIVKTDPTIDESTPHYDTIDIIEQTQAEDETVQIESYDAADIAINAATFPDVNFRNYVSASIDTDHDNVLSSDEISACSKINVQSMGITSLNGIEVFTYLWNLSCGDNQLTNIDLSKNTNLLSLDCYGNKISNLDISNNKSLMLLNCHTNNLTNLDVSKNIYLETLTCQRNEIVNLDVSQNTNLQILACSENQISNLDVSKNTALTSIDCSKNKISSLDFSNNTVLTYISCFDNQIESINISKNTELTDFFCWNNQISSLDIRNNKKLVYLTCDKNRISKLDVSANNNLETLACSLNRLSYLNAQNITKLTAEIKIESTISAWSQSFIIDGDMYKYDLTKQVGKENLVNVSVSSPFTYDSSTGVVTLGQNYTNDDFVYYYNTGNKLMPMSVTITKKALQASRTDVSAFVERLYTKALGRQSDADGKQSWTDYLVAGKMTGAEAAKNFMLGQEFENRHLTNEQFLNVVYQTYYGRDPDEGGYNAWMNYLVNGYSREGVICQFACGDEFQGICDNYGMIRGTIESTQNRDKNPTLTSFVNRIYTKLLDRDAEPDGLNAWTGAIINKEFTVKQTAVLFVESKEFLAHNYSTEDYVTHLYRMFFGREPEKAGFDNWVKYINDGKCTRTQAAEAFADGPEFAAIMKDAGV